MLCEMGSGWPCSLGNRTCKELVKKKKGQSEHVRSIGRISPAHMWLPQGQLFPDLLSTPSLVLYYPFNKSFVFALHKSYYNYKLYLLVLLFNF